MPDYTVKIWSVEKPETLLATYPVSAKGPGDAKRAAAAMFKVDNPKRKGDFWAKAELPK